MEANTDSAVGGEMTNGDSTHSSDKSTKISQDDMETVSMPDDKEPETTPLTETNDNTEDMALDDQHTDNTASTEQSLAVQQTNEDSTQNPEIPATEGDDQETGDGKKRSKEAARYWSLVDKNRQDFTSWTSLIAVVDKEATMEGVKEVYEEFLMYYPFCYGYWKKLADFTAANASYEETVQVYENAVLAIGLSIDVWIAYIDFYLKNEKTEEEIRQLFNRSIEACGLEFRSDKLWDKYIDWEANNGNKINITNIYRQLLATPTKCYNTHYENVKEHINKHELQEILSTEVMAQLLVKANESLANAVKEEETATTDEGDPPPGIDVVPDAVEDKPEEAKAEDSETEPLPTEIVDPNTLSEAQKSAITDMLYTEFNAMFVENEKEVKLRWTFEEGVRRPYFHAKPLDSAQIKNWRSYLDFEIANGGESRTIFLFERCVIACAQYEEFWLKYTTYMESLDRHTDVRNVFMRACRQHLPYKASMHITWAFYEERQGNYDEALEVISNIELQAPDNMCVINHKLNLKRRHGDDLTELFKNYIDNTTISKDSIKLLISKYARYMLKIKGDYTEACDILTKAIAKYPTHEAFYTQLLDVEYQRQPLNEEKILEVFELINDSSLSAETKQTFYSRRYEFIDDLGSDVNKLYSMYQEHEESTSSASKDKKRALSSASSEKIDQSKKARTGGYDNTTATTANAAYNNYQGSQQYYGHGGDWSQYYQQGGDYSQQYAGYQQYPQQQQGYGYTGYNYGGYY